MGPSSTSAYPDFICSQSHYQTFVGSLVAYQNLNKAQFGALMGKIFPIYFSIQTVLPAVLAFTFPRSTSTPAGIHGLLDASNRWGGLVPITTMFLSALANAAVIGPATTKCMYQRRLQGKNFDPRYAIASRAD